MQNFFSIRLSYTISFVLILTIIHSFKSRVCVWGGEGICYFRIHQSLQVRLKKKKIGNRTEVKISCEILFQ